MSKVKYSRVNAIFERDFKEYRSGKPFKIAAVVFILSTIVVIAKLLLFAEDSYTLKLTLCNTILLLAIIPTLVNIPLLTTVPLTRDKANGTIANLLVAPLSPKEIVKGKSRAVFMPGFIAAILSSLTVIIVVNFGLIVSIGGSLYLPVPLLLSVFLITPIFCYELTKFSIQLSMIKSPELAITPSYLIGFVLIIGIPICSSVGIFDLTSWSFLLFYLGITLVMCILVSSFSLLLTKERIVLSNI